MQLSTLARTVVAAVFALPASAQTPVWTFTGSVGDQYGTALLQTADQNNDGFPDLIVGAPGWNNNAGYVRCLSGKFLATGLGSPTLWTVYSPLGANSRFGSSIAEVASLTGDAATDYVVGAPGYIQVLVHTGAVLLIDGSTHAVAWTMFGDLNTSFGASIAPVGDQDGDGKIDIAVTAPSIGSSMPSRAYVVRGSSFGVANTLSAAQYSSINVNGSSVYAAIVASGFDLDHDGRFDVAVGSPDFLGGGTVDVYRADGTWTLLGSTLGQGTERMGASIDGTRDFDGDGFVDLVVGAPNWSNTGALRDGRVVVLSGAKLLAFQAPQILDLRSGLSNVFTDNHFGASVRASNDLNGDGVSDIVVGAPGYSSVGPLGSFRGSATVFSGATGVRMATLAGAVDERLGGALLGGTTDMNGDGFLDFAVAGPLSSNSTTNCGTLKFFSLFPSVWSNYCTGKTNSLGCTPGINGSGVASVNPATGFTISCAGVINQVSGLLFYSHATTATAFQGGTLCVKTPLERSPVLSSGGSASGTDCTGLFLYDFNARIRSGVDPTLVVGSEVFVQCWSRDSASPSTTSLSNGLRFLINP